MDSRRKNSTVVLVFRSRLVNYYLAKGFVILEQKYKHLISVPNNLKLRIYVIDKHKTDYVMACYTAISSVANTLNKLHIRSNLHTTNKTYIMINEINSMKSLINTIYPY